MAPGASRWICATIPLVIVMSALAADTNTQFAPEMWAYLDLSDRARLFFLSSFTDNITEDTRDETVGVHLDLALKPILRRRLRVADWAREKYLWVRVGYRRNFGGSTRETGVLEANSRLHCRLGSGQRAAFARTSATRLADSRCARAIVWISSANCRLAG